MSLLALGVGPGDEVITTPMTFMGTSTAIMSTCARPVFVDVEPHTGNLDVSQIEKVLTPKTKAILPVHLYGCVAEMDAILEIAANHGLPVIEDAAQAHGAIYGGKRAGNLGLVAAFSFYPAKNLGAFGEGGAVVTSDSNIADEVRMLRNWGQDEKSQHLMVGFNYRMDALQGVVLGLKLPFLDQCYDILSNH